MTKRLRRSALNNWATFLILIAVSACGGGGGQSGPPPPERSASASTLASVWTECRVDAQGGTMRQRLQISQGEQTPITVMEVSTTGLRSGLGCVGGNLAGFQLIWLGVFHRLGVSPDGSQVVFEVTDEDVQRTLFPPNTLPAEQNGIFAVRADGSGLRRLGPASRQPPYFANIDVYPAFAFSPNGRTIAYTDLGPSRDNQDAVQIFTLDLVTGEGGPVTQLPPARQVAATAPFGAWLPFFNDDQTITFLTSADPDGTNPDGENIVVTVDTETKKVTPSLPTVAIPGSTVQFGAFQITGAKVSAVVLRLFGRKPKNHPDRSFTQEVFVVDGKDVLQLTNFERDDTFNSTLSADGQRVLFQACADPLLRNPTGACQLFSINRNGSDLRQLTDFRDPTCFVYVPNRDSLSDAIIFYSSCDPNGTNPDGSQIFAVHEDGTGLRPLTDTQGLTTDDANGVVMAEIPFPFAHPGKLQ